VLAEWRGRDALLGERLAWDDGEGTARGVTDSGDLVVETEDGQVQLSAGEVHLRS
jgi:biotin-(acetyl-CoA carboxylase) ligase